MESASTTAANKPKYNPEQLEEFCKNFTHGDSNGMEFYSPMYPQEYRPDITCFRTITAPPGNFIRIDFRDRFLIEPPSSSGKCEYDYLEIRDGDQGYSPLIGKDSSVAKLHLRTYKYVHYQLIQKRPTF